MISLFSKIHASGHTPIGIPFSIRLVPVAPSKITGPSAISAFNSSLVIYSILAICFSASSIFTFYKIRL